jgi:hypothetical protein
MSEICGWCKHYEDSHRKADKACPNVAIGGYLMSTFKTCRHPRYERVDAKHEACVVCGTKQALTHHPVPE